VVILAVLRNARTTFSRAGGLWLLLVAKFIPGLDGVTPPLAGAEGYLGGCVFAVRRLRAFFGSATYTALGFIFADRLSLAILWAERFGTVLAIVIVLPCAIYALWRGYILLRMVGKLRLRRMSPALLASKLAGGGRVAVIDLASFEGEESEREGIPGAVRADPVRLSSYARFTVPEDVAVVLYCSSRNALTSARVALALRRKGVTNVWVLDGGLASWKALGYEVTQDLSTPEELFSRLGIQLPHRNLP
jgi:rhodanese-related sulfurtransferase